ncbi:MAG TPA: hypothetical protein VEG25_11530 [Burkholderiales bacterium]|nr:hypothetical protein [Burkholderiales bacterium]
MLKLYEYSAVVAALFLTGCVSQGELLDSKQAIAVQTAQNQGRFDLNCPDAAATVLSKEVTQPVYGGVFRAEFTIGVAGCGKRETYLVFCPQGGNGCAAVNPNK